MPDLQFQVEQVTVVPFAVAPTLAFSLNVTNSVPDETIHTVALRCQLQLDVTRRNYSADERLAMRDLFGESSRWAQTLRALLWTHVSTVVPAFTGTTRIDLLTPCTFDFNVAATKYFHGLTDGEIPVTFLFSGIVYYQGANGSLQVGPISWEKEARFRLPVAVWRAMMDSYYPNSAWLCLGRDAFESLYRYKVDRGIATWEMAIESLIAQPVKTAVP